MGCYSTKPVYEASHTKSRKIGVKGNFPLPPLGTPPKSPPAPPPSPNGIHEIGYSM